jgi:hypothetical protein
MSTFVVGEAMATEDAIERFFLLVNKNINNILFSNLIELLNNNSHSHPERIA